MASNARGLLACCAAVTLTVSPLRVANASEALSAYGAKAGETHVSLGAGLLLTGTRHSNDVPLPHVSGSLVHAFTDTVDGELSTPIFLGVVGALELGPRVHFGGEGLSVGLRAGGTLLYSVVAKPSDGYVGAYGGVLVSAGSRKIRVTGTYDLSFFPGGTSRVSDGEPEPSRYHRVGVTFEFLVGATTWIFVRGGALIASQPSSRSDVYPMFGAGVAF